MKTISSNNWFTGADVSHPGPGSHLPSIAALVSSVDQEFSQYAVASVRVQEAHVEMIEDMADMFKVHSFSIQSQQHVVTLVLTESLGNLQAKE